MIPPDRITPERITQLVDNQVFVFGSNRGGYHSKGAAKTACKWGAIMGQGEGLMGQTYGIPTKGRKLEVLTVHEIGYAVFRFLRFAEIRSDLHFLVTEVGCGLARHKPRDIAQLFGPIDSIPLNVSLPARFWHVLQPDPTTST